MTPHPNVPIVDREARLWRQPQESTHIPYLWGRSGGRQAPGGTDQGVPDPEGPNVASFSPHTFISGHVRVRVRQTLLHYRPTSPPLVVMRLCVRKTRATLANHCI